MEYTPASTRKRETVNEIAEMISVMNELDSDDERYVWLDRNGWLLPRDAFAICDMLESKDELIDRLKGKINKSVADLKAAA